MALHAAARRREPGQDQKAPDHVHPPPELLVRYAAGQPDVLIVLPKGLLHRDEGCLHLDDEKRSRRVMPREHVDRPAFAVDGVRDLDSDGSARLSQQLCDAPDKVRVSLVHQPIEVPAPPAKLHIELGV